MKKILLSIVLLSALFFSSTNAQSPYELKLKKELTLVGTGLGLGGAAYFFHRQMEPLSLGQIEAFETKGISDWEEWTTGQGSEKSNRASDIILYSAQLIPGVVTLADKSMRKDALKIGVLYSEVFLLNLGVTALVKNTVRRARPYVYDQDYPLEEKLFKSARTSFFSGHTSETAAMCFLTARLFADYHPDSQWKTVVWSAAAIVPAAAGILRMRAGKHFPSDVITGYAVGAAIGYFLPKIHLAPGKKNQTQIIKHF